MLKKTLPLVVLPLLLNATTLPELFRAVKNHSQIKSDEMMIQKAQVAQEMVKAKFYPSINLFAKYDHYTTPSGMVPVPPNKLLPMVKDPSVAQPFSQNIMREGINFTMPLFVKTLFTMSEKTKMMQKSAKAKKEIDILKNEAIIVGANANFLYLQALKKSLNIKEQSLKETEKTIKIKVDNGRAPASALYKINDGINQINIIKDSIALQKEKLLDTIRSITGITLTKPIPMQEAKTLDTSHQIASLKPLLLKIKANQLELKAQKEQLYPTVGIYGSYVLSQADAYNNDKSDSEDYGNIGIAIKVPLFSQEQYKKITQAKVALKTDNVTYQKLQDELASKAKMLQNSLPLLDNSMKLLTRSIENKEKLLKIAKVNYKSGRLATEEYLRYEDDVVSAKAKLYKTQAQKWQTIMQLAVIYANNIEEMIQ
ncbi:outer membrane efflux protein, putative [hydrothermal vent metagenome]|uniref:Outer membrane efflux protein, putative n=1 Tax=hydrothermal vent metagenome TaxID=652676 RepID=A0A1W1D3U5_9ZZZZ